MKSTHLKFPALTFIVINVLVKLWPQNEIKVWKTLPQRTDDWSISVALEEVKL